MAHRIDIAMLGKLDPVDLDIASRWGVGSWRDDAEEVRADVVGIRVSDNLVLYPKALEALRAAEELDASESWA